MWVQSRGAQGPTLVRQEVKESQGGEKMSRLGTKLKALPATPGKET